MITPSKALSGSIGPEFRTDVHLLSEEFGVSLIPSSSTDPLMNQSNRKASTKGCEAYALCFDKTRRTNKCPLISEKQMKRHSQARHPKMRGHNILEANQYDAPFQSMSPGRDSVKNQRHNKHTHHQRSSYLKMPSLTRKTDRGRRTGGMFPYRIPSNDDRRIFRDC